MHMLRRGAAPSARCYLYQSALCFFRLVGGAFCRSPEQAFLPALLVGRWPTLVRQGLAQE